jgi:hypothetical protein
MSKEPAPSLSKASAALVVGLVASIVDFLDSWQLLKNNKPAPWRGFVLQHSLV